MIDTSKETKFPRLLTPDELDDLLREYATMSGVTTMKAFCSARGVNYGQFVRRNVKVGIAPRRLSVPASSAPNPGLRGLEIAAAPPPRDRPVAEVPCSVLECPGVRLHLPPMDVESLSELLAAVGRTLSC